MIILSDGTIWDRKSDIYVSCDDIERNLSWYNSVPPADVFVVGGKEWIPTPLNYPILGSKPVSRLYCFLDANKWRFIMWFEPNINQTMNQFHVKTFCNEDDAKKHAIDVSLRLIVLAKVTR